MNPERLKQLRQSWTGRRGQATVHALIDAIEAADKMREEVRAVNDDDPYRLNEAAALYDAAKARI